MQCHHTSSGIVKIQKTGIPSAGEGVEQLKLSPHTTGGDTKGQGFTLYLGSTIKLNVHLPYDTTIPHADICPREMIIHIQKDFYRNVHRDSMNNTCPSAREQMNKLWTFVQWNTALQAKGINY